MLNLTSEYKMRTLLITIKIVPHRNIVFNKYEDSLLKLSVVHNLFTHRFSKCTTTWWIKMEVYTNEVYSEWPHRISNLPK